MDDEIIQEVWKIKDAMAKRFNYDLRFLGNEMQKRQQSRGRQLVDFSSRQEKAHIETLEKVALRLGVDFTPANNNNFLVVFYCVSFRFHLV